MYYAIAHTPVTQLNPDIQLPEDDPRLKPVVQKKSKYEDANLGCPTDMDTSDILQMALVDTILELEGKIFNGNLGHLKVQDRAAWRANLDSRSFEKVRTKGI